MHTESKADQPPPSNGDQLRYLLIQIPELVLVIGVLLLAYEGEWLSSGSVALILAVWIVKEIAMFFVFRKAHAPREGGSTHDPLGEVGVAHLGVEDEAYVRLGHELWRARRAPGAPPIPPGELVRVVGLEGLTVLVEGCAASRED